MNALRRLATALATVALWGGLASPILATDEATVDATVQMAAQCLITSTPWVDFGPAIFSPDNGTPVYRTQGIEYTNCSIADQRIFARGTDATETGGTGTGAWTLSGSEVGCPDLGVNRFGLDVMIGIVPSALTTLDRQVASLAPGLTEQDDLRLRTPCLGSNGIGATMTFQVVLTATF